MRERSVRLCEWGEYGNRTCRLDHLLLQGDCSACHDRKNGAAKGRIEDRRWLRRLPAGARAVLDLNTPIVVSGSVVVATFHTHPNPSAEGWATGPSPADTQSAWILGVPCLIRADDGIHTTGPASRRGGLSGDPGFPT